MLPGVPGAELTVTAKVWAADVPQVLLAVTVMLPLVVLELAVMVFVVELPVQPTGSVQV